MIELAKIEIMPDYRIRVMFKDGVKGVIDLSDKLFGTVFAPLKDPRIFAQARIDEFGAICWPNGADLAPDAVYETLTQQATVASHSLRKRNKSR